VPGVREGMHDSRPQSGEEVETPRHDAVRDAVGGADAEGRLSGLWGEDGAGAVGGEERAVHWETAHGIMERAVERGLARRELDVVRHVGMDEKSFRRGHSYVSLLSDLEEQRVLEVVEGRKREDADSLWDTLSEELKASVEAVAIDMWEAFAGSARAKVPHAAIVYDKFHISGHLGKALDQVRRREHRELMKEGDETLKRTRQLWLFNVENVTEERWMEFEKLLGMNLRCAEAWAMKENFRNFWDYKYAANAKKFFERWDAWVEKEGETPMRKVATMLRERLEEVLNYFRHPITNAYSEGINSKVQAIKSTARGFRGFANYRIRILFFCGKLDMSLSPSTH